MHETVWLGRGGQGAFTAARLLGVAAMVSGRYAMAMPSFGPERRGAPVFAYTRIDEVRVRDRSAVSKCDVAVVLDASLLTQVPTAFIGRDSLVIVDSEVETHIPGTQRHTHRRFALPARAIARKTIGSDHTGSVMLGALLGLTGLLPPSAAEEAIRREFSKGASHEKAEKNLLAFRSALAQCFRIGQAFPRSP